MGTQLQIIALDLEGTLISNAVSQIPRPGLAEFLDFCARAVPRLVLYSAVPEAKGRDIIGGLIADGVVPQWFQAVDYVYAEGVLKDLRAIAGASVENTVLVDDYEGCVVRQQRSRWISIDSYVAPYRENDAELRRVQRVLEAEWGCRAG